MQNQEEEEFNKEVQTFLRARTGSSDARKGKGTHCKLENKLQAEIQETASSDEYDGNIDGDSEALAPKRDKWTIKRGSYYRLWELWIIIVCFVTTMLYPYVIMNNLFSFDHIVYQLLWVGEFFMLCDIGVKFFLQEYEEDGITSKKESLNTVAQRYLHNGFMLDLVAFIPFPTLIDLIWQGDIVEDQEVVNSDFKVFWSIKIVRIAILNKFLSQKFMIQWLNIYILSK